MVCGWVATRPAHAQGAFGVKPVEGKANPGKGVGKAEGKEIKPAPIVKGTRRGLTLGPDPLGTYEGWRAGTNRVVTTLAQDREGALWVATEEAGVWRYTVGAASDANKSGAVGKWTQFTAKDGLADESAYALAVDKQGRVWAGTLNHGVSVWNGKEWRNYGVLDGALGERVFDIAVCPVDGDVWIATNAGLTRYSVAKDSWSYVTLAQGLPSGQVQAIAFDQSGNIVLGTQTDGVALASAAEGYKNWRVVKGPDKMPLTPTGTGLPSSLINDVLVARDGTIYVATTTGLAWSGDGGANWRYVRGQDYAAKVRDLWGGAPAGWKAAENPGVLLVEDYVSCLAQDEAGRLWLGHWVEGSEVVEMGGPAGGIKRFVGQESGGSIEEILPVAGDQMLLARYERGVSRSSLGQDEKLTKVGSIPKLPLTVAAFPSPVGAPSEQELQRLLELVRNHVQTPNATRVVQLPDDWTTQGTWLGRYGRYWASLNAMLSPRNYNWGAGREPIYFVAKIGPNAAKGDSLRYWVHTLYTDNQRALEMPAIYFQSRLAKGLVKRVNGSASQKDRRQSEWDDHGEVYPMTKEGPDIYITLKIPDGNFILSLYNRNKDGHAGTARARDYKISIRPHDYKKSLYEIADFDQTPEWAQARQRDFWGGEWTKFAVQGPQDLTVKVGRNYSSNTILAGMFLDEINEEPDPYFDAPKADASVRIVRWSAEKAMPQDGAAEQLWTALETAKSDDVLWWSSQSRIFYQALLRHYQTAATRTASAQMPALWSRLGTCYYQLNLYPQWEQMQERRGLTTARQIETELRWDGAPATSGKGLAYVTASVWADRLKTLAQTPASK